MAALKPSFANQGVPFFGGNKAGLLPLGLRLQPASLQRSALSFTGSGDAYMVAHAHRFTKGRGARGSSVGNEKNRFHGVCLVAIVFLVQHRQRQLDGLLEELEQARCNLADHCDLRRPPNPSEPCGEIP